MDTLKLKRPYMSGLVVKRFQQFGEAVLDDADYLENDGIFGKKTETLAKDVQSKLGIEVTGIVDQPTWDAVFEYLGRNESGARVYSRDGVKVIDGRDVWKPVKKWYGDMRPWTGADRNKITGVMLHQTGCWMPEDPEVWRKINAHIGITRDGTIILMFPFEMLIWHGNDLTRPTIGIEIAGLMNGIEGDNRTHWPRDAKVHKFTETQEKACDVLFHIILEEFQANDGNWVNVYAHRQSSSSRQADPGSEIWQKVGMPWLTAIAGTDGGPNFKIGSGMPIPREWNPAYPSKFWG